MRPRQATPFAALRRMAGTQLGAKPDEELLQKFCADRDEAAFAVLVQRHGGLVLDICRAVVRNEADAEDCFQATFIALATDARRIRRPAALAGWLHAVACRTAAKGWRTQQRRRIREARVPVRSDASDTDRSWIEVRQSIHEEVNRLPDRYRAAIVLYYLVGQTQDEVGRALGLSTAGAKKRLERGRSLLRGALERRGFGPTAALAAAAITLPTPKLALATDATEMAVGYAINRATAPMAVRSLLSSGVRAMSAKIAFGAAVVLGVATTIGLSALHGGPQDQSTRLGDPQVVVQARPQEGAGEPVRAQNPLKVASGSEGPKGAPPPSRPATAIDQFRELEPGERLKLIEKLAGAKLPFTAATRDDLLVTIIERGSIEPASYADVVCKVKAKENTVATTIKWVIDEGSMVKKGDRLALLDDTGAREQLQAATEKTKEAEAAMLLTAATLALVQ